MNEYNVLYTLMGGYLNQDMYIICDCSTLEGAVDYYVSYVDEIVLHELLEDIARFEEDFRNDLDGAFEEQFSPEVEIASVSNFFTLLRETIKKHYPDMV
ncbi:contact-dependent growth inhibition system immunity protein [Oligella sp. HMSC09E12]|uniref:contact-dependent growth inhibition system immunity protein n=1 Tax=Oligella sp. HMSC09E12 TaxID=1581147 RepID=UPI0008A4FAF5|nr:contact-dependent growth inhibition system immunity protein [Oligella sp. HMSC09E12]OFV48186.1 hypothetical protein HMPREF3179_06670 [Oligella sp. HMSC09E12]